MNHKKRDINVSMYATKYGIPAYLSNGLGHIFQITCLKPLGLKMASANENIEP